MSDITRSEALKELKEYEEGLDMEYATPFDKAILFAISSLETDEAYQLEYEKPFDKLVADYCKEHGQVIVDKDVWDDVKEYVKPEFCEDAISRAEAIKEFCKQTCETPNCRFRDKGVIHASCDEVDVLKRLPSVLPKATKNDLGVDCISRQAVLEQAYAYGNGLEPDGYCVNVEDIQALSSVTPIRPKGHWICDGKGRSFADYHCSECGLKLALCGQDIKQRQDSGYSLFCGGCGADMREAVEDGKA